MTDPVTIPTLLSYIVGSAVNVALIAYGSRRLLGVRHFPFTRTIVAGLLGELGGNRIINALASGIHEQRLNIGPILAFLGLGAASSLLLSMAILLTWQALQRLLLALDRRDPADQRGRSALHGSLRAIFVHQNSVKHRSSVLICILFED